MFLVRLQLWELRGHIKDLKEYNSFNQLILYGIVSRDSVSPLTYIFLPEVIFSTPVISLATQAFICAVGKVDTPTGKLTKCGVQVMGRDL